MVDTEEGVFSYFIIDVAVPLSNVEEGRTGRTTFIPDGRGAFRD